MSDYHTGCVLLLPMGPGHTFMTHPKRMHVRME